MKNTFWISIILAISSIACSNGVDNNNSGKAGLPYKQVNGDGNKEEFDIFFDKFNLDSVYQTTHIEFPLEIRSLEEDSESKSYIGKDEWRFTQLLSQKNMKSIIKKEVVNEHEVKIEYLVEDTGIRVNHFFKYEHDKWVLYYVIDESD